MGRIFIAGGHGGQEVGGTTEAKEMIALRDQIVREVKARNFEILAVPDDLTELQVVSWINQRSRSGDVALLIRTDAATNPSVRGGSVFYVANNNQRQNQADLLLRLLLLRLPQLPSRGAKPDTATGLGQLVFCRQVTIPSLQMDVGFLTNPDDRSLIQNRRSDFAMGIADGLAAWSRAVDGTGTGNGTTYAQIKINVNGQNYEEQGILVNGNAYIPIDLVDRFKIDLSKDPNIIRVTYQNVVYVKAIELRNFHVAVTWDSGTRTISLRSSLDYCPNTFDQIMGRGKTSEVQLLMFLKANNENALTEFPDIAKLYREEAGYSGNPAEGVNYDIAFSQMCVETGFLRFGGDIKPSQNNFAGLGSLGGDSVSASFPSARIGVRAHIQHLKAYASIEPLTKDVVDPRFRFVTRGIATTIDQLSGRWTSDPNYGKKIKAVLTSLYESTGLL